MLLILHPDTDETSEAYRVTLDFLQQLPGIKIKKHLVQGQEQSLTEIYLIGNTQTLDKSELEALPAVERAIKISEEYRVLGRHRDDKRISGFDYQGLRFDQDTLHVFAGLCAVDNPKNVETMLRALRDNGQAVHAHGRVQTAHESVCISGPRCRSACHGYSSSRVSTALKSSRWK